MSVCNPALWKDDRKRRARQGTVEKKRGRWSRRETQPSPQEVHKLIISIYGWEEWLTAGITLLGGRAWSRSLSLVSCLNAFILHKVTWDMNHFTCVHVRGCECTRIITHPSEHVSCQMILTSEQKLLSFMKWVRWPTWNGPKWHWETSLFPLPHGCYNKVPKTGWL